MRLAALALLLVACGGGGGSAPFTPSADIRVSHPFLRAAWQGTGTNDVGPAQVDASLSARSWLASSGIRDNFDASVFIPPYVDVRGGPLQADGDRVRMVTTNRFSSFYSTGQVELELLAVDNQTRLVGTYRVTIPATATAREEVHTGTVNLLRGASLPATIELREIIETPEVVVIVRTTYTEPAR